MALPPNSTSSTNSTAGSSTPVLLDLATNQGALLIGTFFGVILYGLSIHQTYQYFRAFSKDASYIRFLVVAVLLLETVHAVVNMHSCYYYLVTHYFNEQVLQSGVWSLNCLPLFSGVVIFVSQLFFVRRVYLIGPRQRLIAGASLVLLTGELGLSIASTVESFRDPSRNGLETVLHFGASSLGVAGIADIALTVTLIMAIRQTRSGEDRVKIESPFDVVQLYIINTGLAAGAFNIVSFAVGVRYPKTLLLGSISIITTRLYGNALLAVLNSREIRGMEVFASNALSVTFARAQREANMDLWNTPKVRDPGPAKIDIEVTTEMEDLGDKWMKHRSGGSDAGQLGENECGDSQSAVTKV